MYTERIPKIFISSTVTDLKKERSIIINTLYQNGIHPVCMETFERIHTNNLQKVSSAIDTSDALFLIVGFHRGSLLSKERDSSFLHLIDQNDNVSQTEYEYYYANKYNKPIYAFQLKYGKPWFRNGNNNKLRKLTANNGNFCIFAKKRAELIDKIKTQALELKNSDNIRGMIHNDYLSLFENIAKHDINILDAFAKEFKYFDYNPDYLQKEQFVTACLEKFKLIDHRCDELFNLILADIRMNNDKNDINIKFNELANQISKTHIWRKPR